MHHHWSLNVKSEEWWDSLFSLYILRTHQDKNRQTALIGQAGKSPWRHWQASKCVIISQGHIFFLTGRDDDLIAMMMKRYWKRLEMRWASSMFRKIMSRGRWRAVCVYKLVVMPPNVDVAHHHRCTAISLTHVANLFWMWLILHSRCTVDEAYRWQW